MFDLKRGAHLYDNVRLLRAKISDVGGRFVDSDIQLRRAALNSEVHVAFALKGSGSVRARDYALDFAGKRYASGRLAFAFKQVGAAALCTVRAELNGVEALGALDPLTGAGAVVHELGAAALATLRTGVNQVTWRVTPASCELTISASHVALSVPAIDSVVDFSGSPYSFVELDPRTYDFVGSWTVDVWVFRDAVIYTQRGRLLSLVPPGSSGPRARDDGTLRIYETGSTGRGVVVEYLASRLRFAAFSTPVGTWFHYTVAVEARDGQCALHVLLDGRPLVRDNEPVVAACGALGGVAAGAAGDGHKLRVGSGFAGKLNDLRIRRGAWATARDVLADMHRLKTFAEPSLLAAYSFDVALGTTVFDSRPSAAEGSGRGEVREGTFRTLVYGIFHLWKRCPGTSYFSPEAVCSTRSLFEHGYCSHERDSDDFECTCNPGYHNLDCSGECPGMSATGEACSGHGECFTFNATFCVCGAGYVGDACEHECPGWTEPLNVPQRECWGHGDCLLTDDGEAARCLCDAESSRYGPFCQFQYGEDPVASIVDKCRDCDGEHKACLDGVCVCEDGHYMFFGACKPNAAASLSALSALVAAALVAIVL
eukprot:TRINITY_DN981_c0_g1_i1.p2 TRINITY_DN981_c0_g1~~TRINITY_DN981_c0_g1_i1.p2  ORF type:complete len:598 (-),score=427.14 TRINITY_DN981_c0_g1_i1:62-1855(-)